MGCVFVFFVLHCGYNNVTYISFQSLIIDQGCERSLNEIAFQSSRRQAIDVKAHSDYSCRYLMTQTHSHNRNTLMVYNERKLHNYYNPFSLEKWVHMCGQRPHYEISMRLTFDTFLFFFFFCLNQQLSTYVHRNENPHARD